MERRPLVLISGRVQELPLGDSIPSGEEDMIYAERVDFVGEDIIYKGQAAVGSSESAAVWRIHKMILGTDGDVSKQWASSAFDQVWANRASLSYT